jgi:hypothetical protein
MGRQPHLYYQIRAAVISPDGTVTPSFELAPSTSGQYAPHAVFDGSHFVVAWEEQTDAGSDIRMARVDRHATPVDAAFVTLSPVTERSPALLVEGPRSLWVAYSRILPESPYGASRVRLRRMHVNHPPSVPEYTVVTVENTAVPVSVSASDEDGDALTYAVVQPSSFGALSSSAPEWLYTPNPGFSGDDAFVFRVDDGFDPVERQVRIRVLPQADRPSAQGASVVTQEDTPVDIFLQAAAPSGGTLTYEFMSLPAHGRFKGTPPDLSYNPDADYFGPDFFSFRVSDGVSASDIAIVTIEVLPENDPPVAFDQDLQTRANESLLIALQAADVDNEALTFEITQLPSHGKIKGNPPFIQYIPNKNYFGDDILQFSVSDGQAISVGEVRITVENTLRRELDGDTSWGCRMSPSSSPHSPKWAWFLLAALGFCVWPAGATNCGVGVGVATSRNRSTLVFTPARELDSHPSSVARRPSPVSVFTVWHPRTGSPW